MTRGEWFSCAGRSLVAGAALMISALFSSGAELPQLVPATNEVPGWKQAEAPRIFAHDELFDLIDGGAELYHEYGFVQAVSVRLDGPSAQTLQLEIYEMKSAAAAFGVYSLMQSPKGERLAIGQAACRFPDYLVFWQGPFYASLTLTGRVKGSAEELATIARWIADRISVRGAAPSLIDALPKMGLQETKYFRGPVALSNVHVFGAGNVFGTVESARGLYADHQLFVFNYASGAQAADQFKAAAGALRGDRSYRELVANDTRFEGVDGDGNQLTAWLDGGRIFVRLAPPAAAARANDR